MWRPFNFNVVFLAGLKVSDLLRVGLSTTPIAGRTTGTTITFSIRHRCLILRIVLGLSVTGL